MTRRASTLAAAGGVVLFCALGLTFLHSAGAQFDEVLFGSAIYPPIGIESTLAIGRVSVPLMLMTYIGALKAWLWYPLLRAFGPSVESLRLPALAAAAASVWLFFLALRRWVDPRIAALAALLLATDVNYLLTSLYDWGPVALQHLFFMLAISAGVRGWWFVLGLSAGLALFDKAVSIWLLAGLGVAFLIVFPRVVLRCARSPRRLGLLTAGFLLGAAPLIYYNATQSLRTFTADVGFTTDDYAGKTRLLGLALRGNGLFGYLTREEAALAPPAAPSLSEQISLRVSAALGNPRNSLQMLLAALSLLLLPLLLFGPTGRIALWLALGAVFACGLMFSTANAGGALHHTILLWPIPQLLIGLACGEIQRRAPRAFPALALLLIVGVGSNLAVANTLRAQMLTNGPTTVWSDALPRLIETLDRYSTRPVYAVEWGISEQVRFFGAGKHAVSTAALTDPNLIYVDHSEAQRLIPADAANLDERAAAQGLRRRVLETIPDRHGRPIFDVFEYARQPQ
jgi:hypothetical protein